jgi:hypothetical protein
MREYELDSSYTGKKQMTDSFLNTVIKTPEFCRRRKFIDYVGVYEFLKDSSPRTYLV